MKTSEAFSALTELFEVVNSIFYSIDYDVRTNVITVKELQDKCCNAENKDDANMFAARAEKLIHKNKYYEKIKKIIENELSPIINLAEKMEVLDD